MSDIKFSYPLFSQTIEAPHELSEQLADYPICMQAIETPCRSAHIAPPVPTASQSSATVYPWGTGSPASPIARHNTHQTASEAKVSRGQRTVIGSLACLVMVVVSTPLSLGWIFVYGPVFIAAFARSIVAIAQRRMVAGFFTFLSSSIRTNLTSPAFFEPGVF